MSALAVELLMPGAVSIHFSDNDFTVDLDDGRFISIPLAWYPHLYHASTEERNHWRIIGNGHGIHWKDIDEGISVEGLIAGKGSNES
jgi:hypothetical protein